MKVKNFKDWSILTKLMSLGAFSFLPIIIIFLIKILPDVETQFMTEKKKMIQSVVETGHSILASYHDKFESGALSEEEAKQKAVDELNKLRYQNKEYYFIYDLDGVTRGLGSDPSKIGTNRYDLTDKKGNKFLQDMIEVCKKNDGGFVEYWYPKLGETEPSPKLSYVKLFKPWDWFIGTGLYMDDVQENISSFRFGLITALVIALLIALPAAYFLALKIVNPIKKLKNNASEIINGNTNIEIEVKSNDEVGSLSSDFKKMVQSINKSMTEIKEKNTIAENALKDAENAERKAQNQSEYLSRNTQTLLFEMEKFANGDLTVHVEAENNDDEIGKLFAGFNLAVDKIRSMINSVNDAIEATASSGEEISASAAQMAAGSQEQSAQTTEVASAVEEMTSTILETSKNAVSAAEYANNAGKIANEGGSVVKQTLEGMNEISQIVLNAAKEVKKLGSNTDEIGKIVQVIDEIADQTNLLALNAAIEAARAGEEGRGFAVVADEVRKLAERTTKATKEIADMIKAIQTSTDSTVKSIEKGTQVSETGMKSAERAGSSLKQIIESSDKVREVIDQVAVATEEQSTTAEEISKNIEGINSVAQESAHGVQQIANTAEDLASLTINLREKISNFHLK